MVFSSQVFLFYFLPLFLLAYYAFPRRWRNAYLALASYVFYGWWSPWFVILMLVSTVVDWCAGLVISRRDLPLARRKLALALALVANLLLLGFFKYFVFVAENLSRLLEVFGAEGFRVFQVVLPIGISFYTLQSMSYSIDIYRGSAERARTFPDFACYVAMFPQLIAGPIVRYKEVSRQLVERPQRGELLLEGTVVFAIGFAKKILLANTMGEMADIAFASGSMPAHVAWFGVIAYTFQAYFDFSGYSDMAIGLGLMLGFRLPINFRSPYRSVSVTDLWRRWHITLGAWIRDYLYVGLGGSRAGRVRTYLNLFFTMLVVGIWHGAEWTFVLFGVLHGVVLLLERASGRECLWAFLPGPLRVVPTYLFWIFTMALFRSDGLAETWSYWQAMLLGSGDAAAGAVSAARVFQPFYLYVALLCATVIWLGRETSAITARLEQRPLVAFGSLGAFALGVLVMFAQAENPFIYFRF